MKNVKKALLIAVLMAPFTSILADETIYSEVMMSNPAWSNLSTLDKKLRIAVTKPHIEEVKKLLAQGADPNSKDNHGNTPLIETAQASIMNPYGGDKYEKVMMYLLAWNADASIKNNEGESVIYFAERSPNINEPMVQFLKEKAAE